MSTGGYHQDSFSRKGKTMKIAAVQFQGHREKEVNIQKSSQLIRQSADQGARIICLPELFDRRPEIYGELTQ